MRITRPKSFLLPPLFLALWLGCFIREVAPTGSFSATAGNLGAQAVAVRVVSRRAAAGSVVAVPIELESPGNVTAVGFSLRFNAALLGNAQIVLSSEAVAGGAAPPLVDLSQAAQGRIGIGVGFAPSNPPRTFPTERLPVVIASFAIPAGATPENAAIEFDNTPFPRQVLDTRNAELRAEFTPGAVAISQGYEADIAPRPQGSNDGTVNLADWSQTGRFVVGLDGVGRGGEFQRADCAPRATFGDGRITIIDWVQAARYASGADPVVPAGGPTFPSPAARAANFPDSLGVSDEIAETSEARVVRIVGAETGRWRRGAVAIELDARGDESALGFSLSFDPTRLRFVSATTGDDASGCLLHVNASQSAGGRVGFALILPAGQSLAPGTRQMVIATFAGLSDGNLAALGFDDQPMACEVSDGRARILPAIFREAR